MHRATSVSRNQKTACRNDAQAPKVHFAAHGDCQNNTSVFDVCDTNAPFRVHMILWREVAPRYKDREIQGRASASTLVDPNPGPALTLLIQNSYFDTPYALKNGLAILYDRTEGVDVFFGDCHKEIASHIEDTDALGGPWVMLGHHDAYGDLPPDTTADPSSITFSPSSLITLPPHTGISPVERRIEQDLTGVLRPIVKAGHSYSIRLKKQETLPTQWWKWGTSEKFLSSADSAIARSRTTSQHDAQINNLLLSLNDLPPPESGPVRGNTSPSTRPVSFNFRVVARWAAPPVLRVKLALVPLMEDQREGASSDNDYNATNSHSIPQYTITATTTTLTLPSSSANSVTGALFPRPITLKLSSSQPIAVPFSYTHHRGLRQFTSPDILPPIYGTNPSLTSFHIIDTLTGEDLVQHATREHPQGSTHRREQFITLNPGDEVVREGIQLPYPSDFLPNGNRKPKQGDPGYRAPDVRDMVTGRKYRITLRDNVLVDGGNS